MNTKAKINDKDENKEILELIGECKEIIKKINEILEKPVSITS